MPANTVRSSAASRRACPQWPVFAGACSFILLVTAGLLALSACAHSPQGVQREVLLYEATSNTLHAVSQAAPYVPPPAAPLLEGLLALGGALMAVWASHLHRSLKEIRNGAPPPLGTADPPKPPNQTG